MFLVNNISSLDGNTLFEGWLWIRTILLELLIYAYLKISLGWTLDLFKVPINNNLLSINLLLLSRYIQ